MVSWKSLSALTISSSRSHRSWDSASPLGSANKNLFHLPASVDERLANSLDRAFSVAAPYHVIFPITRSVWWLLPPRLSECSKHRFLWVPGSSGQYRRQLFELRLFYLLVPSELSKVLEFWLAHHLSWVPMWDQDLMWQMGWWETGHLSQKMILWAHLI